MSEDDSTESEPCIEEEEKPTISIESQSTMNAVPPPESKRKLVFKLSVPKKSSISQNTLDQCYDPTTSSRLEEESSRPVSGDHNTIRDKEENGRTEDRKPTIIKIKSKMQLASDVKPAGECSQTKTEVDEIASQKRKTIKFKFNTVNAKNDDSLTADDSSANAMPRTKPLRFNVNSREINDAPQNHKKAVHTIPTSSSMTSASGSKSNSQLGKTNWLLLSSQEGNRYIPQLCDEVVYFRQVCTRDYSIYYFNKLKVA